MKKAIMLQLALHSYLMRESIRIPTHLQRWTFVVDNVFFFFIYIKPTLPFFLTPFYVTVALMS